MPRGNESTVSLFLLLGFSSLEERQVLLFLVFSPVYVIILTSNITIMAAISVDRSLHTPMYFLLFALSFSETCTTVAVVPKLLVSLLSGNQTISFLGCAAQMFCFFGFGGTNCFLLSAMAYDRYVAICKPLQYPVVINRRVCVELVAVSCATGFLIALGISSLIFSLPFCGPNAIRHFFCDISPVLRLACSDHHITGIAIVFLCAFVLLGTFTGIILSYIYILAAILKIRSATGRRKTFSTCASHLIVVITHFSCAFFVYLIPKSTASLDEDTLIALSYTLFSPMLNPVVYSLRNREVKSALRKLTAHTFLSPKM
ncbi:olfactory receptor 10T2-like [Trachemys scripta elegans]|uniref:olfactory receptor 10T2-like n=1 Tax=Trachemys scripta elegans TaxID=31138 RepID=UPI001557380F|nr:olfactory receptor 10T2-like [Trachemys scripta elegans]